MPCTLIKAVSDGVDGDIEAFDKHADSAADGCVRLIADYIATL